MTRALTLGLAWLTASLPAASVEARQQVEVFGALTTSTTAPAAQFTVDYVPRLVFGTVTGGRARHALNLEGGRSPGFEAGLNWLPVPRAGLQVFVARSECDLGGANAPYSLELQYLARQPPDFVEREYSLQQSVTWPESLGDVGAWRVGVGGLARFSGSHADLSLSGGLLLTRLSGAFQPAGYYEYRLGGHSTIFYNEVLVSMALDEAWHPGYHLGAELGVRAGARVRFIAGLRLFGPSPVPLARVADVLNEDQMLFSVPRSDIEAAIGGRPVAFDRLDRVVLRFGLGVGF
ncbi:MAG TPA: hypothetical protein VGA44_09890 [Steroidobacteraceae bacterium]